MQTPVRKVAIAEAIFASLIGLLLAGEWAGLGPDGTVTAALLTTTLAVVVGLVLVLPVLLFAAAREMTKPETHRTIAQMSIVGIGVALWLVLAIWLAFLYFSGALTGR